MRQYGFLMQGLRELARGAVAFWPIASILACLLLRRFSGLSEHDQFMRTRPN
jgi:hypothetical protein